MILGNEQVSEKSHNRFDELGGEIPEFVAGAWIDLELGVWHAVKGLRPEFQGTDVLAVATEMIQGDGIRQFESILAALRGSPSATIREVALSVGQHMALVQLSERFPSRVAVFLFNDTVPFTKMLRWTRLLVAELEALPS